MNRIGVLTAGGDTPALNATLHGVVARANELRIEVFGLLKGYHSLLTNPVPYLRLNPLFQPIPELDPTYGGSILGSSRAYVDSNDQNVVTNFIEKGRLPFWINGGVYLFDRQIESMLPDIGDHETSTFQDLAKEGRLLVYRSDMAWMSIESLKDLTDITAQIKEGHLVLDGI